MTEMTAQQLEEICPDVKAGDKVKITQKNEPVKWGYVLDVGKRGITIQYEGGEEATFEKKDLNNGKAVLDITDKASVKTYTLPRRKEEENPDKPKKISPEESWQIAVAVSEGATYREVADSFGISVGGAQYHVKKNWDKLEKMKKEKPAEKETQSPVKSKEEPVPPETEIELCKDCIREPVCKYKSKVAELPEWATCKYYMEGTV